MTTAVTNEIRKWSRDEERAESLLALMDFCGVNCLAKISDEQALKFLAKLESGEIRLSEVGFA